MTRWTITLLILPSCQLAFGAKPEATAAYDRYVQLTEAAYPKSLWLDQHKREKSLVWLNQGFVTGHKTLDHDREIIAPDGVIQDWIGDVFIPGVTLERVRDTILTYGEYKQWFKEDVLESREEKREGDHFEVFLRLHRRQISKVVLNVKLGVDYRLIDSSHAVIVARSVHVGEAKHAKQKDYEEEEPAANEAGYLWGITMLWRLERADNGIYAELEVITVSRDAGRFATARVLNGFVDNYPKQFTGYISEAFRKILAPAANR